MNLLVKIGAGLFAVFLFFSMVGQCTKRSEPVRTSVPAPVQAEPAKPASTDMVMREYARGLDLKAVSELAKKAKDGADFERLLNDSTEAVNNLDLNDDNKVDYINVTEFGGGNRRGFSLTTEVEPGKVQEIATIEFSKESDQKATVQTTGNPSMYGPGYNHHSSFGLTDALLLGWMFSSRPSYASPYGAGNYPPSYGDGWSRRPSDQYSGDMGRRTAGSSFERSAAPSIGTPLASPNAEKTAARAKAIANPTQSQRSFATRSSEGRPSGSGGFGRPSGSGSSSSGTSTSRPSSGGFGGSSGSSKSPSSAGSSSSSGSYGSSSRSSSSSSSGFGRSSSSGSSRSGGSGGGGK